MGETPPDPMVFRSDDNMQYGEMPGYQDPSMQYVPPAYGQQPNHNGGGKGKGGGRGSGKGGGKGGGRGSKAKGKGYGSGYGDSYDPHHGSAPSKITDEEQDFMDQMENMNINPPVSSEPLPEYNTYLDTNTGHQRLKGGAMLIVEPTAADIEKHKREEAASLAGFEEEC